MWRTKRLWLAFGALAGGVALMVALGGNWREPRYEGRRYTHWVTLLSEPNSGATEAIGKVGTNGIPYLLKLIEYEPHGLDHLAELLAWLSRRPPLVSWNTSGNAARAFEILGTNAAPVIPVLLERARTRPGSLTRYPRALAGIGEPVLPVIRPSLEGTNLYMQFVAVRTLVDMPEQPALRQEVERSHPGLMKLLANSSDEAWDARNAVLDLMKRFRPPAEVAIAPLIQMLDEKNDHLRGKAIEMLGAYGPAAAGSLPKLQSLHGALTNDVRGAQWIQQSILRIRQEAPSPLAAPGPGRSQNDFDD